MLLGNQQYVPFSRLPASQTDSLMKEFHEDHGSSSNSDAISSESWDCSANFDPDRHAPFLRRIGDLTGTRITFDEFSQQLVVVAKDEASVKETIVRLNHLQAALV